MKLIDSHCHIHDSEFYPDSQEDVYARAAENDIGMICIGTDLRSSWQAVQFASSHDNAWATVGVHPHDAKDGIEGIEAIIKEKPACLVGIGEIGLDYFYEHSPRTVQIQVLEAQLQLAIDYNLPVSFHVRQAFDDFWTVLDKFPGIRGVLHSFTDTKEQVDKALKRGLFIGINGISTFTKDSEQMQLYGTIPLDKILVETDAPFLTPTPHRGKINEPRFVERVAEHMAELRGVSSTLVSDQTTRNTRGLFEI